MSVTMVRVHTIGMMTPSAITVPVILMRFAELVNSDRVIA